MIFPMLAKNYSLLVILHTPVRFAVVGAVRVSVLSENADAY